MSSREVQCEFVVWGTDQRCRFVATSTATHPDPTVGAIEVCDGHAELLAAVAPFVSEGP